MNINNIVETKRITTLFIASCGDSANEVNEDIIALYTNTLPKDLGLTSIY